MTVKTRGVVAGFARRVTALEGLTLHECISNV